MLGGKLIGEATPTSRAQLCILRNFLASFAVIIGVTAMLILATHEDAIIALFFGADADSGVDTVVERVHEGGSSVASSGGKDATVEATRWERDDLRSVWPLLCAMQLVNSLVFVYDGLIFATQRWTYVRNVMLVACLGKLSLNQPCDSTFRRFLYLYFIWMLCVVHLRRCLRADFGFRLRCSTVSLISAITFFSFFLFFSAVYFESIFSLLPPPLFLALSLSLSLFRHGAWSGRRQPPLLWVWVAKCALQGVRLVGNGGLLHCSPLARSWDTAASRVVEGESQI